MPAPSSNEVLAFCRLHLSEDESERLVGWIAWRTGRPSALAGSGEPIERLSRALQEWIDADRRVALLAWMRHRLDRGLPPVPR